MEPFFPNSNDANAENYVVPEGVLAIGNEAFKNWKQLRSISLPKSVEAIGEDAFLGCSSLTSIELPKGVRVLEAGVFSGCKKLNSIVLSGELTSIGDCAFSF